MGNIREFFRTWWKAFVVFMGAILTGVEAAFNVTGLNLDPKSVLVIGFLVFVLFGGWQMIQPQIKLNRLQSRHPNILPDGFEVEVFRLWIHERERLPNIGSSDTSIIPPYEFTRKVTEAETIERWYLRLRNTQKIGLSLVDSDAVYATLDFFNGRFKKLKFISHERAFWRETKPYEAPKDIIFKASGEPQDLCLVAREQNSVDYFVFSKESYDQGIRSMQPFRPEAKLPDILVYIRVKLSAANFDIEPIWIKFTNRGTRQPKLELIENPM